MFRAIIALLIASAVSGLLVVVGDVGTDYARVLYDTHAYPSTTSFRTQLKSSTLTRHETVSSADGPRVLQWTALEANTLYHVTFYVDEHVVARASLKTLGTELTDVIVASCNRVFEDGDEEHLTYLADSFKTRHHPTPMVHLGDQIYADHAFSVPYYGTYEEALERFRNVYRQTWGRPVMQRILRHGPNWMIPDDHEIRNNVDTWMIHDKGYRNLVLAGRTAYLEYQYQLWSDISKTYDPASLSWDIDVFQQKRVGDTTLVFLDMRLSRVFEDPFVNATNTLGNRQFDRFQNAMMREQGRTGPIVVFASSPLLFIPKNMAILGELIEKDVMPTNPRLYEETMRIVDTLFQHASRVSYIGGDVHLYVTSTICNGTVCMSQTITSGLTRKSTVLNNPLLYLYGMFTAFFTNFGYANQYRVSFDDFYLSRNFLQLRFQEGMLTRTPHFGPITTSESRCIALFNASRYAPTVLLSVGVLYIMKRWLAI